MDLREYNFIGTKYDIRVNIVGLNIKLSILDKRGKLVEGFEVSLLSFLSGIGIDLTKILSKFR
jgi:hypothetical protein